MKKKKIKKLIFGNLGFLIGFVVLFSPGLLGLSIVDASAVKAALSLTLGIMMPAGMVAYNYKTISQKNDVKLKSYSRLDEYLAIMLLNDEQYRILLYITVLTNGKYKDISDFLLNKNNNIIKKQVL